MQTAFYMCLFLDFHKLADVPCILLWIKPKVIGILVYFVLCYVWWQIEEANEDMVNVQMLKFFVVILFSKIFPLLLAIIISATLAEKWDDSAPLLFSQTHLGI